MDPVRVTPLMVAVAVVALCAGGAAGDNSFCNTPGKVMQPGFAVSPNMDVCVLFLFQDWVVDSAWAYLFAVFGCFAIAFCSEMLVFVRKFYAARVFGGPLPHQLPLGVFYGLQMLIAYFLMLLVMTYDILFFTAIVLGLAIGHTVFAIVLPRHVNINCAPPVPVSVIHDVLPIKSIGGPSYQSTYQASGHSPCCANTDAQ